MQPSRIRSDIDNRIVFGNYEYAGDQVENPLFLHYEFYSDLSTRAIASSEAFDTSAELLYQTDKVPFLADAIYLDGLRDSIQYWNGEVSFSI